jgi:phage gp36-like protein
MAYCTEDDLLKMISAAELAELTTESGEAPDSLIMAEAMSAAAAEIDACLGVKYVVPLASVPAQVRTLAVDLAIYRLYSRRSVVPLVRQRQYEAAVSFLKQVAEGRMVIVGPSGEPPTVAKDVVDAGSASRIFSRNTLGDW